MFDVISDLQNSIQTYRPPSDYRGDTTLLVAGDVGHYESDLHLIVEFFKKACNAYHFVLYVPGNHEYYSKKKIPTYFKDTIDNELKEELKQFNNLRVLIDESVEFTEDRVIVYGGTMWTKRTKETSSLKVPIFTEPDVKMTVNMWNKLHYDFLTGLERAQREARKKRMKLVVLTHYPPISDHCISEKYIGNSDQEMHTNELSYFFGSQIPLWVFGHTGHNCDVNIYGTRVVSNQYTYDESSTRYDQSLQIIL